MSGDWIERAARVVPSMRQYRWQQLEFYAFAHFGINTFTDREWGDGTEDPSLFNPTDFDADQWVAAVKSAGMRALILTCKHHDGFCLWPSAYTEHSVKNSPWRGGKGDVVREVSEACRRGGIRFGVYLSPWDRHEATYGDSDAYNAFYQNQLRELARNYGQLFCFWFDGACGEGANGKRQAYDWPAYYRIIREEQPQAVISVCGPDVRWCGNEAGLCRESEWSVVPSSLFDNARIAERSQQADDGAFGRRLLETDADLGSRAVIREAKELIWYPAEVDTSIRKGWFYHADEDGKVRSLNELLKIYYGSVGANAALLLNVPPDRRGRIADPDVRRLRELGEALRSAFARELKAVQSAQGEDAVTLTFSEPTAVACAVLQEDILQGQRVEAFELWADGRRIFQGTVIGHKRICRFCPVTLRRLTLRVTQSRLPAKLLPIRAYGCEAV